MLSSSVYFTVAISLALLVNPIRGQVFNDLEIAIQSFPGYADLPVCGVAVLAGRPGCVCFGETDVVHFVSCETAACICGIQKEAAITRIRNRGAFVCGTTDLATPPAAIALLESFCAAQAVTSTPSTPTPAPATVSCYHYQSASSNDLINSVLCIVRGPFTDSVNTYPTRAPNVFLITRRFEHSHPFCTTAPWQPGRVTSVAKMPAMRKQPMLL
jgi:hypothetical protein